MGYVRRQTHTRTMWYLLLFPCNNSCTNSVTLYVHSPFCFVFLLFLLKTFYYGTSILSKGELIKSGTSGDSTKDRCVLRCIMWLEGRRKDNTWRACSFSEMAKLRVASSKIECWPPLILSNSERNWPRNRVFWTYRKFYVMAVLVLYFRTVHVVIFILFKTNSGTPFNTHIYSHLKH
jgi:hypothetical protein